jgi:gliding motility-associated-like protein
MISSDTIICKGATLQLFSSSNYPVTWNSSPYLSCTACNDPFANPSSTTTFIVTASNGICSTADSVTVSVVDFSVDAGNDTMIIEGQSVTLNGTGAESYQWLPSSFLSDSSVADPTATPVTTITYILFGTSHEGCIARDSVTIRVLSACDGIFIPDAFSPNGDGVNDEFGIISIAGITINSFSIFNRWGELIFQTNDLHKKWNGNYKEIPCPLDVYVYLADLFCGEKKMMKGNITLIR